MVHLEDYGGRGYNQILINFTNIFDGTNTQGKVNAPDCNRLDLSNSLATDELQRVATHEFGHFLGLHHSGVHDVFANGDDPDVAPSMSTCLGYSDGLQRSYKQDDEAALSYLHSILTPRALVGNLGFERGNTIWTKSGSSAVLTYKSGASLANNGGYYVHYRNVSGSDNLYQTISFAARNQVRSLQTIANFRLPPTSYSPTASGTARVELVLNAVPYAAPSGCESSVFVDGRNHNARGIPGGFFIARALSCGVSYTWSVCATQAYALDFQHDVKTRIYSNIKNSSGALIGVEVDDLRTRDVT